MKLRFAAYIGKSGQTVASRRGHPAWLNAFVLCVGIFFAAHLYSQDQPTRDGQSYVFRGRLRPGLRESLVALGDRLERSGKERVVLQGTLQRTGSPAIPVKLTRELPGLLRLEEAAGTQTRVTTFDGKEIKKSGGLVSQQDEDLLETLLNDSADHFFIAQAQGAPVRFLGSRFRLDDGRTKTYQGSYYEVYQVTDRAKIKREAGQQSKLYYVNSDTLLVERVRYEMVRDGARIRVLVQMSQWGQIQDQRLPRQIVRLENGQPVLSLSITAAAVSPRVDDGIFSNP
ncbi:MAG: hypothetical protein L0387_26455 [Acidobacteria bacterium]|nr:hypothetical protein [Acidobacteriota bacterium]